MEEYKQTNMINRAKKLFKVSLIIFMCSFYNTINAQQKTITGVITDDTNMPIPGVSIIIKGTTTGTQSDFDGNFTIKAAKGDTLQFSYIGMKTVSKLIEDSFELSIIMKFDAVSLDEIVVVGYGTQKKSDLISSVASVKTEEMMKVATSDVGEMLRGKAAGVRGYTWRWRSR
ncbi:carboxypeptidase-like regulatory domain-containing protein [Polaribacter sejongensis]|uniref:carboxypeptidase-like regulatory domain-containing protein n=1 Tax=Polaribacter sejongensis TaxID=985043 RepID=UPI0035A6263A